MLPIGCARTTSACPPKPQDFEAVKAMEAARAASKRRAGARPDFASAYNTGRMSLLGRTLIHYEVRLTW